MDDSNVSINQFDPIALERYFEDVTFPISQEDLMGFVRAKNPPQDIIEQMEQLLQSEMYYSPDQLANELGGFYNDGEAASQDGEDLEIG